MRYQLTVRRMVNNEHYEAELKDWEERNRRGWDLPIRPMPENQQLALETILTEEEFNAVKKAAIEVCK